MSGVLGKHVAALVRVSGKSMAPVSTVVFDLPRPNHFYLR